MFSNLFKKSDKPSAAVFVDYEHWYYGYNNIFSMKPNVQEWYDELTEEYNVKKLMFFGDFNGSAIEKELPKLEKITKNVVQRHCEDEQRCPSKGGRQTFGLLCAAVQVRH